MLTDKPIPIEKLTAELKHQSCGGIAIFMGRIRSHNHGKKVKSLNYEAYEPMVKSVFSQITDEAIREFRVHEVKIVHRLGDLKIGDVAVWIGVQSGHRGETFAACQYVIDELKKRAPIWKKEYYVNHENEWVRCDHDKEIEMRKPIA